MKKLLLALCCLLVWSTVCQAASTVQEGIVWYRIHLGMGVGDMAVAPQKMHAFIDEVITPAFPNGLTITESRGQWKSPEHGLIRERTTVVDVQCPDNEVNWQSLESIAETYVQRFKAARSSVFIVRVAPVTTTLIY